eukprot:5533770-Karenia_brevis.AAC.1
MGPLQYCDHLGLIWKSSKGSSGNHLGVIQSIIWDSSENHVRSWKLSGGHLGVILGSLVCQG